MAFVISRKCFLLIIIFFAVIDQSVAQENKSQHFPAFKNIGPSIMGGRVVDIEVNPKNPNEFYVAYSTGGVWVTKNNGQSFEPIFDSVSALSIGDIAVEWNLIPEQRSIWVGTGDPVSGVSSYAGSGVYISNDCGKSWRSVGLKESHHIGKILLHPRKKNIAWIAVLGNLHSTSEKRGIYKTVNAGQTWNKVLYINDSTGCVDLDINPANPDEIYATAWCRIRKPWKTVLEGKSSGIYKSRNGGGSWQLLTGNNSGFITGEGVGRIGVSVYKNNPKIIYAVVDNRNEDSSWKENPEKHPLSRFSNITKEEFLQVSEKSLDTVLSYYKQFSNYSGKMILEMVRLDKLKPTAMYDYFYNGFRKHMGTEIYRSDNSGKTWFKTQTKNVSFDEGMGFFFGKIRVSPYNENKVFILSASLMLSEDGGKTFKGMDKGNTHPDHHAIWINPKNDKHIIEGNDGGVNITYDNGSNWFKVTTVSVGQFYKISVDGRKPYNIYGGMQDNGVWFGPSNYIEDQNWINKGAYPFRNIIAGDGAHVLIDSRDNNTIYYGQQAGFYWRAQVSDVLFDDAFELAGESSTIADPIEEFDLPEEYFFKNESAVLKIRPTNEIWEDRVRFNWITPVLLSKHNEDILYYGTNRFYRSTDKGEHMIALSDDLTNGLKLTNGSKCDCKDSYATISIISESPIKFGLIYVGTDDGNVHISRDVGNSWHKIGGVTLPFNGKNKNTTDSVRDFLVTSGFRVSCILASKHKEGRTYVSLNGRYSNNYSSLLYRSDDYGHNWKQVGVNIAVEPINVIKEDPQRDSLIYIGTDGGLYVSYNCGEKFEKWNSGLPRSIIVNDIAIQERENEIILATFGRSLFLAKLNYVQSLSK